MRRSLALAACLAVVAAPLVRANAQTARSVTLQTGHSVVLDEPAVARVAVGDKNVVSVRPIGDAQLLVTGRSPGHSSAIVWTRGHRAVYEIDVVEDAAGRLASMVRSAIPFDTVNVRTFDRSLVVEGTVDDPRAMATVNAVLVRFSAITAARKFTVVNAVTMTHPLGTLQQKIAAVAGPDVQIDPDGKGGLIVSGPVADRTRAEWVLAHVRGLAGPYLAADAKVTDRLEVASVSQIDVKVRVYEVDKTALDQLGVRLQSIVPNDPLNPTSYTLSSTPSFPLAEAGSSVGIGAFIRTTRLAPTLDLLVQRGDAKMLSEPNLLTLPGTAASFLVGGEIPIPYTTGVGQTSIVYKEYGVRLNITPTLLGSGAVEAKLTPEVSDLDYQDGVASSGFTIPSLRTSRLTTDVVAQNGESIVLGGLMRHVEQRTVQKIPVLGSLPVLGPLFRSTRYQNDQTDVVFVMTPTVVTK